MNRREQRYRTQLRQCGFRSWKRANQRRCDLIEKDITGDLTTAEQDELAKLQRLADIYVKWKTNDSLGRSIRRVKARLKKHGIAINTARPATDLS